MISNLNVRKKSDVNEWCAGLQQQNHTHFSLRFRLERFEGRDTFHEVGRVLVWVMEDPYAVLLVPLMNVWADRVEVSFDEVR